MDRKKLPKAFSVLVVEQGRVGKRKAHGAHKRRVENGTKKPV